MHTQKSPWVSKGSHIKKPKASKGSRAKLSKASKGFALKYKTVKRLLQQLARSYGVMVNTQDSEFKSWWDYCLIHNFAI